MFRRRRRQSSGSTFLCASCGAEHPGPPRAYSVGSAPYGWEITQDPASRRWGELGDEQAVVHGPDGPETWFLRGNLEIPVHDDGGPLAFTVWVSVSELDWERACELWSDPGRVNEPARAGQLSAWVPSYELLDEGPVVMRESEPGLRPLVFFGDCQHALALDQRDGISADRLSRLAEVILHPPAGEGG